MQVPEKSQFISVNLQVDCLACGRQAGTGLQNGSSDSLCCWPAWLVLHGLDCLCLVIQYCYNSQNCPLSSLWRRTYSWHFNNNILWHFHILPGCLSEGLLNWSWKTPWKSQDPTCRAGAVGALQQVQPDEAEALPPLQPLRPLRQEDGPSLSLDKQLCGWRQPLALSAVVFLHWAAYLLRTDVFFLPLLLFSSTKKA